MDCPQDLAINNLTILDQSNEYSLLCMGNAIFRQDIKIYEDLHLYKNIITSGNIIPLNYTSSIGTSEHQWLELHVADANINCLNVDVINVKHLNCVSINEQINKQINEQINEQINGQINEQINKQINKQINGQINGQIN